MICYVILNDQLYQPQSVRKMLERIGIIIVTSRKKLILIYRVHRKFCRCCYGR